MPEKVIGFGWYIRRISNAMAREADRDMLAHHLTMQQSHLLFCLYDAPEYTWTLKELEGLFSCAQSTIAGLVARMEKKGLVRGYTDAQDRRVKHVQLTEAGIAMRQACHEDIVKSEARWVAILSDEEREVFRICLEKVYATIQEDAEDAPNPMLIPPRPTKGTSDGREG